MRSFSHGYKYTLEADNIHKGNILTASVDSNGSWTVGITIKNGSSDWHEDVHAHRPIWEDHRKWQGLAEKFKIDSDEWNRFREFVKLEESKSRNANLMQSEIDDPEDGRPIIIVTNRHLQDITADALDSIIASNSPPYIFVRAGNLVRIRSDEHGTMGIELLNESALRGILARAAKFVEVRENRTANTDPPLKVVKDLLALPSWGDIPPIKGLIASPVIRPDGSILDYFGYDLFTELYYAAQHELVLQVPDNLTQEDARTAADFVISEIFGDFPFKDDASRANALAALLSVIAKPLINGNIPLGLFDKPQAGTGASLLTEIIAEIATGAPAHLQTAPNADDEWRKAITSTLMDGPSIVVIDNVENMLKSRSLSQMLTARIWADRMLGQSKMVHLPQTAAWFATGNNIQLGGDIARRSYWIRLDAGSARPWLRKGFKHDPLIEWVRAHRDHILLSLLIMVKAWLAAGRPEYDVLLLGSFNEWCRTIGDILAFAGVEAFLGNASQLYENADHEIAQWDLFLGEWRKLHGDTPITSATLKSELTAFGLDAMIFRPLQAEMPEDVIEATGNKNRGIQALGVVLRGRASQIFPSGRKLVSELDKHTKAQKWTVIESEIPELGSIDAAGSSDDLKTICKGDFAGTAGSENISNGIPGKNIIEKNIFDLESCNRHDLLPAVPANQGNDSDLSRSKVPADPGSRKFKEAIKKRICIECGRSFSCDLFIHYRDGFICYNCHSGQTCLDATIQVVKILKSQSNK